MNKEQNYISAVVVVDDAKNHNIDTVINWYYMLRNFCNTHFDNYEIIIVNNNATPQLIAAVKQAIKPPHQLSESDNSNHYNSAPQQLESASPSMCNVQLITLPYALNKEQAMLVGINGAIGDYVFEFEDTYLDYQDSHLWQMYLSCLNGNDIVLLRPRYKTDFLTRKFYSLLSTYSNKNNMLYPSRVHLVSRRAINRVNSINKVIHYRKYAYCNAGLNYAFIQYKTNQCNANGGTLSSNTNRITIKSQSTKQRLTLRHKLSFGAIDHATDMLLMFTGIGKRIAMLFSFIFAIISISTVVYVIITYITKQVVEGWTTIMMLLAISFTGIFGCFAMVIKYLSLILSNQQRNETNIASKENLSNKT